MNYHPDDFLAIIEEVERQGGAHLSEVCKPTPFRLNLPLDFDNPSGPKVKTRVETTGCHRSAKFLVPLLPDAYFYEHGIGSDEDMDFDDEENPMAVMGDGSPAMAKVCAVDDAMGLWPRFSDTLHTGESFQE